MSEARKLKMICAWCPGKDLKDKKYKALGYNLTHGLCKKCAKIYF